MVGAFLNLGWPDNEPLLRELFELREELAKLVGYDTWADYDAGVKMIGKGAAIPEFIDRITEVAHESAERDRDVLLARLRVDHPDVTAIDGVDYPYYEELVRKEQYDVDAQVVRTYFDFARVRAGLLDVTSRLFDLTYTPVDDAVVWHPDVTAYDVTLAGETTLLWAGSTSTSTRARASTPTPPSSRSPTASPAGSCPRASWCATSPRA